ncbi:MAG TPA: DUF480 domain-containing protein [Rhodothermales bacterium]|nr:DUF480 domain-containing protein [Rhodothermales bacterium]
MHAEDQHTDIPTLDFAETRVLGCLIEKERSTPDYYPMSINALTQACNQKTNREPVAEFGEGEVEDTLAALQRKRLVGTASGAGSRVLKYRHALAEVLGLSDADLAVLAVLMLRGPQTVGEIRGRTGRMHEFDDLGEVEQVLHALATQESPFVTELERQPGQKEARYAHLLSGELEVETTVMTGSVSGSRLDQLEDEVLQLREELETLRTAFEAFRKQFE